MRGGAEREGDAMSLLEAIPYAALFVVSLFAIWDRRSVHREAYRLALRHVSEEAQRQGWLCEKAQDGIAKLVREVER